MTRLHPDPTPSERAYWRKNVQLVLILLAVWFAVSYGAGVLFAEWLDQWRIPGTGFPLGFWFAQQGSIYVFVVLIFVYVFRMNRLDGEFGVGEGPSTESGAAPGDVSASGGGTSRGERPREVDGAAEVDAASEAGGAPETHGGGS